MRLNEIKIGQRGKILKIHSPELEMILMKLGLVRGDTFTLTHQAPFKGPMALQSNGTQIAVRRHDAAKIEVSVAHGK